MLRVVVLAGLALCVAAPVMAQGVPANSPFAVETAEQAADRAAQVKRNKEMIAAQKRRAAAARKAAAARRAAAAEAARKAEEERQMQMSQPEPVTAPVATQPFETMPVEPAAPASPAAATAAPVEPITPEAPVAPVEPAMPAADAAAPIAPIEGGMEVPPSE